MHWSIRFAPLVVIVATMSAQVPGTGSMELGGFVGATYGLGSYAEMGGGNFSYAVNKYLLPYVEFSYFPYLERQTSGTIAGTESYKANYSLAATDFHGGIHFRVPIKESRIVPYGVLGLGRLGFSQAPVNITYTVGSGSSASTVTTTLHSPSTGAFAVNFGGGLRFYVHPRFGLRVEAKGYKPTGQATGPGSFGYNSPFLKVEGGFFLQFR